MKVAAFLYHPIHQVGEKLYLKPHHGRFLDGLADRLERVELCAPYFREQDIPQELKDRGLVYDYQPRSSRLVLLRGLSGKWSYPLRFFQQFGALLRADAAFFFTPSIGSIVFGPLLWILRKPYVCYVAVDLEPYFQDRFGSFLGRVIAGLEDRVIARSCGVLATGARNRDRWKGRTRVEWVKPLLNFDPLAMLQRSESVVRYRSGGAYHFIYAGVISPRKRIEVMVDAVAGLRALGLDAQLRIFGAPSPEFLEYAHSLRQKVEQLGLGDRITFEGFVSNPERLALAYGEADFFILPSIYEGFPKAVFEAMVFGAIPVLSRVDSYVGFLEERKNVVFADSAEQVVSGVAALREEDRERMREANRALLKSFLDRSAAEQAAELLRTTGRQ
jgi:glycosyltransferase involved in cell wall biosynthesis